MNTTDTTWMNDAACATRPDLGWLAEPEDVGFGEEAAMAMVCARCPVQPPARTTRPARA